MTPTDTPTHAFTVRRLPTVTDAELRSLSGLLMDCVEGGASYKVLGS